MVEFGTNGHRGAWLDTRAAFRDGHNHRWDRYGDAMINDPGIPMLALIILSFFAGFAFAIWLAITMDKDAREMDDKMEHEP
jgi:hypothetical protein